MKTTSSARSLGWQRQMPWRLKLANVVLRDPANWWRTVQIDLGTRDGVVENLPVLTADGLVGRVSSVGSRASQVVLIGDPNCRVSARVENPAHDIGIISASGPLDNSLVELTYLSGSANLKSGQERRHQRPRRHFSERHSRRPDRGFAAGRIRPLLRGARETFRQPRRAGTSLGAANPHAQLMNVLQHHLDSRRRVSRGVRRSRVARPRHLLGAQVDLLPAMMVYAALNTNLVPSRCSPFSAACGSTRFRRIRWASPSCRCSPSAS